MSGDRELGRIVAGHMRQDDLSDVANSRHLDPERPPLTVLQELDDQHDHGIVVRDYDDLQSGDKVVCQEPLTGHDVFKPWPERTPVSDQLRAEEHARTRRLAQEALARMDAHLPVGAAERKAIPVATGFMDYFPDAIAAVARLSKIGNDQHNPGTPLHWDRSKSTDEADTMMRHFLDRGTFDNDGVRHSVKMAWRALALLQKEIEAAKGRLEPVFKEPDNAS